MSQIAESVKHLLAKLESAPIVGNTKELLDQTITINPGSTDFKTEEMAVKALYHDLGSRLNYEEKYETEKHHYEMLKHGLLQKIMATKYFHQQGVESRKLVFLNPISEDCISMIHWRTWTGEAEPQHRMYVFIRSSDVKALLPMDMLYMLETFYAVMSTDNLHPEFRNTLTFQIASAHIYLGGNEQRTLFEEKTSKVRGPNPVRR